MAQRDVSAGKILGRIKQFKKMEAFGLESRFTGIIEKAEKDHADGAITADERDEILRRTADHVDAAIDNLKSVRSRPSIDIE